MYKFSEFKNQIEAAKKLLEFLPKRDLVDQKTLIICPSLDSVVLVNEICLELGLNYEMMFCETIQAPNNPECDIAVVSETKDVILNEDLIKAFNITSDYVYGEAHRRYEEKILKNIYKFRKGSTLCSVQGRNVLLIDEGCETGMTAMICIKTLINSGVKTVSYATPVIATDVAVAIADLVDEIYTVDKIADFIDVDSYYEDKLSFDNDVLMAILEDSPRYLSLQKQ